MKDNSCPFKWRASTHTAVAGDVAVGAEDSISSRCMDEAVPRGAPSIEEVQLGVGEPRVLPPNETFPVGGRLSHFRDKWTFSPWAHSIVSKGLGWSWIEGQPPRGKSFYQELAPLLLEYAQ